MGDNFLPEKSEGTNVVVSGITLENVSYGGLGSMELNMIASEVTAYMQELEKNTNSVNTFKNALVAAFHFRASLYMMEQEKDNFRNTSEVKLDNMIKLLSSAVKSQQ